MKVNKNAVGITRCRNHVPYDDCGHPRVRGTVAVWSRSRSLSVKVSPKATPAHRPVHITIRHLLGAPLNGTSDEWPRPGVHEKCTCRGLAVVTHTSENNGRISIKYFYENAQCARLIAPSSKDLISEVNAYFTGHASHPHNKSRSGKPQDVRMMQTRLHAFFHTHSPAAVSRHQDATVSHTGDLARRSKSSEFKEHQSQRVASNYHRRLMKHSLSAHADCLVCTIALLWNMGVGCIFSALVSSSFPQALNSILEMGLRADCASWLSQFMDRLGGRRVNLLSLSIIGDPVSAFQYSTCTGLQNIEAVQCECVTKTINHWSRWGEWIGLQGELTSAFLTSSFGISEVFKHRHTNLPELRDRVIFKTQNPAGGGRVRTGFNSLHGIKCCGGMGEGSSTKERPEVHAEEAGSCDTLHPSEADHKIVMVCTLPRILEWIPLVDLFSGKSDKSRKTLAFRYTRRSRELFRVICPRIVHGGATNDEEG
ncbi:hypothetical protein J6590_016460 [Homalodisca vitripennis]|nr:hypothetical protein J6590_016460 [Homalodisca vitripennis]